ncbi:DUF805 domain-containing protein [Levilactobacillus spicheri]|uniref:Membrane protein n=1 Tax=Levilactobacillus spicheri TaxID=216463 RepID=A0A0F3RS28_9LACO|nr:DUF805 domain-containing protein [Levilactobacillus spicheri]KJW12781.1 membrane protein [Levilactobacillus spicheri]
MSQASKYCINCGREIPTAATFCPFCGASQSATESSQPIQPATNDSATDSHPHFNMWSAFRLGVSQVFTWHQRIARPAFWWLYLDLVIISLILSTISANTIFRAPAFWFDPSFFSWSSFIWLLIYSACLSFTSVMQITATVRRLHDTNRSAHNLWWLLLPIAGPIVLIVFLAQKSQPAGSRFDRPAKNSKSWIHKWWTWCILVLLTILYVFSYNYTGYVTATTTSQASEFQSTVPDDTASDTTDDTSEDDDSDEDDSSSDDSVMIGDSKIDVSDSQTYDTDYSDSNWAGSTFSIDEITVYETDGTYTQGSGSDKEEFQGVIKIHMNIQAGRDITAYPTQSKLSTNDGQQVDVDSDSDDFDGDLNSGTESDGYLYYVIPNLSDVSDITQIRLKWDAYYDTDDIDDDNDYKTFDATINLNS